MRRVPPVQFEDMKTPAQMRRVDERLKLLHQPRLHAALKTEEPRATHFGEPSALVFEPSHLASKPHPCLCNCCEINMRGDVDFPRPLKRILGRTVF